MCESAGYSPFNKCCIFISLNMWTNTITSCLQITSELVWKNALSKLITYQDGISDHVNKLKAPLAS